MRKLNAIDNSAAQKRSKLNHDKKRKRQQLQPAAGQKKLCGFGFVAGTGSRVNEPERQVQETETHACITDHRNPTNPPSAGSGDGRRGKVHHRNPTNPPSAGSGDGGCEYVDRFDGPSTSDGQARVARAAE